MSMTGIHHLGLTVTSAERSARWYESVLGFERVGAYVAPGGERRKVFLHHPDLAVRLGLTEHRATADGAFDETRVGLDHLAFGVASEAELRGWEARLAGHGAVYTPAAPANSVPGAAVVVFRDPDGIQLELFFDPADAAAR